MTNGELTKDLHMNIKTVLRSLAQLREFGYIEVHGMTSNRVIHCIDPYLINSKTIKERQLLLLKKTVANTSKTKQRIPDIKKLELDKWFSDYLNDTDLGIRTSDIYFYLKKQKIETSKFTKKLIFKDSDPLKISELDKIHFKNYINHRRHKEITENSIEKR